MLRTIVLFLILALTPAAAFGGETHKTTGPEHLILRDELGRRAGSVEREGDRAVLRDELGRRQGTITKEGLRDDLVIRDNLGRRAGRIEKERR